VHVTEKPDSLHRVHVRSRETLDMIELEPARFAAPAVVVAHELAPPLGTLVHRSPDCVGDVARPRHRLRRSSGVSRLSTDGESLLLQVHDQGIEGLVTVAAKGPDPIQAGTVSRILYALRIKHIKAFSPQARGRSERAFGTIQGRLPQELRLNRIQTYAGANRYLDRTFVPDFNSRFTVKPAQPESAFTPVEDVDLDLLVSIHHARVVRNDNTVLFANRILQLPATPSRPHHARCDVTVHEFVNGDLGVSYQDRLLLRVGPAGLPTRLRQPNRKSGPRERGFDRTSLSAHAA